MTLGGRSIATLLILSAGGEAVQHIGGYEFFQWIGRIFMSHKSNLGDYDVQLHHETPGERGAYLVSDDGDKDKAVWIPKSQCEIEPSPTGHGYVITLPEWLAIEKGLA